MEDYMNRYENQTESKLVKIVQKIITDMNECRTTEKLYTEFVCNFRIAKLEVSSDYVLLYIC